VADLGQWRQRAVALTGTFNRFHDNALSTVKPVQAPAVRVADAGLADS